MRSNKTSGKAYMISMVRIAHALGKSATWLKKKKTYVGMAAETRDPASFDPSAHNRGTVISACSHSHCLR